MKKCYDDIEELREYSADLNNRFLDASEYCRTLEAQMKEFQDNSGAINDYCRDLERQIREKDTYIDSCNSYITELQQHIDRIYHSHSWKLVKFLQKLRVGRKGYK